MAEGLVAGAVVSIIIEKVIKCAKDALICTRVCKKLQQELEHIRPDVQKIEQQMVHLRRLSSEPLEVVEGWLVRLKEKLTEADRVVHRCRSESNASRFHLMENHELTKKIQGLLSDINKVAGDDVSRATLSSSIAYGLRSNGCCSSPDTSQHGPSHHGYGGSASVGGSISGLAAQSSLLHRQRMYEIDSILDAEHQTRQSMNLRRHTIASFDFSRPAEQPVAHVDVEDPVLHFQHQQVQQPHVQNFPHHGHYYAPQEGSQQQEWLHSSFHGHYV